MDRYFRGFVSGLIGGVAMNIWSLFSYHILHFSTLRMLDWAGIMIYGHLPMTFLGSAYALTVHLFWTGFLGIVFAYLITYTTSQHYILKGIIFSVISGIIIYSLPRLFHIQNLTTTPFTTSVSDHTGGIIFGVTMAYFLGKFDRLPSRK